MAFNELMTALQILGMEATTIWSKSFPVYVPHRIVHTFEKLMRFITARSGTVQLARAVHTAVE